MAEINRKYQNLSNTMEKNPTSDAEEWQNVKNKYTNTSTKPEDK